MRRRQQVDLGREGTDVGNAAAIDVHAFLDDALAHQLLSQRADGRLDLARPVGEFVAERGTDLVAGGVERGIALGLAPDQVGLGDGSSPDSLDPGPDVVLVVAERIERDGLNRTTGRGEGFDEAALQVDGLADPLLGRFEPGRQHLLGDLGSAGLVVLPGLLGPARLDHHDGDLAVGVVGQRVAGHDELEGGLLTLLEGRMRDPVALGRVRDAHRPDRAVEGDARDHQRRRGRVDGQHVVRVHLVGADDGPDHVDLVAEALGERGPQRPVDQPAGQDGLVRALALTPEERAGDLARGVGPLLDVDGEGEEVRPLRTDRAAVAVASRTVSPMRASTAPSASWASFPASNDMVRSVPLIGADTEMALDWLASLLASPLDP